MRNSVNRFIFYLFFSSNLFSLHLEKYDPYQIRLGSRISPPSEFCKYIYDRLKYAKKNNKYVLADFEELKRRKSFEEIDEVLLISEEIVQNQWENISYKKIRYVNKCHGEKDCVEITKRSRRYYIKLHYKSIARRVGTIIAEAKYQKTGVLINLAALNSKSRQRYLNHDHLLQAIQRERECISSADTPIFFQKI